MRDALAVARTTFTLPIERHAGEPPEARGLGRDDVRLLVAPTGELDHARFCDLARFLHAGDLLVVNTSATLAAAVDGIRPDGRSTVVHFSAPLEDGDWAVELRGPDGPLPGAGAGDTVYLPGDGRIGLLGSHPAHVHAERGRLWRARLEVDRPVEDYLARFGRPITYGYVDGRWPLEAYQTVFARQRGSAEMPSAARPFTHRLVTDLVARGVGIAPLLLHTGVSSLDAGEPPQEERFEVLASTAARVNETRRAGGLVIAVGTTVARALETVARHNGVVVPGRGRTDLVLGPERPPRAVDALLTGWHAPQASHLLLLEAVAGPDWVQHAYDAAIEAGYLWHEFGDSCLFLPESRRRRHLIDATSSRAA